MLTQQGVLKMHSDIDTCHTPEAWKLPGQTVTRAAVFSTGSWH